MHLPSNILAIDPGTTASAYVHYDPAKKAILASGYLPNIEMREHLKQSNYEAVAVERIASYGMAVGRETLETCEWVGRFQECSKTDTYLCYRKDIKIFLCNSMRAKDANIRQALIDLIGEQGTKKNRGPTYGMKSHNWAALAVAVYAADYITKNRNQ